VQGDRVERLERLLAVGRSLLADLELESLLERVLETAQELTGARYAALGVLDSTRSHLDRFLTRGVDESTRSQIGDLPRGRGVLGVLIEEPKPLRLLEVGSHPRSYGFPNGHPPMSSFLGVPILVRGEPFGNLYLAEHPAGAFTEADERDVGVLADWASLAIANARAYTGVAGRRDELELAVERLEATSEIARVLAGETSLARVLELIVKRARALTEARSAAVLLGSGDEVTVAAVAGELSQEVVGRRLEADETVAGQVLASGRSERVLDASSRLQFALGEVSGAKTGLFVPMIFHGRPLGVLEVFDRLGETTEFSPADERLLEAFAASAAAAVATAQTVASETFKRSVDAQEAERRRWARELHDETLQELAALKLLLASAAAGGSATGQPSLLERANTRIDETVRGLRNLITELRPAQLDDVGLAAAIEALVDRTRELTRVHVDLTIDLDHETGRAPARLPQQVEITVYRLVQEALTNAIKHAQPTRLRIAISTSNDTIAVAVEDDGKGFDTEVVSTGFGLLGMRERVSIAGGTMTVDSALGRGTTITAHIPTGSHAIAQAAAGAA